MAFTLLAPLTRIKVPNRKSYQDELYKQRSTSAYSNEIHLDGGHLDEQTVGAGPRAARA